MLGKHPMRTLFAALALVTLVAGSAQAATLLTMKTHQDEFEMQGQTQPAQDGEVKLWLDEGKITRDDGKSLIILDQETVYLVNHETESYNALDLPVDLAEMVPEEMKGQYDQMREMATMSAEVTASEETLEVGEWTAQRYDVMLSNAVGFEVKQTIWASPDVSVGPKLYNALTAALAALQPGGAEWVEEIQSIEGFPVRRTTTMKIGPNAEVTTTEELVSVEEMDAPEGTFVVPDSYEELPFNLGGQPPAQADS